MKCREIFNEMSCDNMKKEVIETFDRRWHSHEKRHKAWYFASKADIEIYFEEIITSTKTNGVFTHAVSTFLF